MLTEVSFKNLDGIPSRLGHMLCVDLILVIVEVHLWL